MTRLLIFFLIVVFSSPYVFADTNKYADDPVLLTVGEREVTLSDFEYVYNKNNMNPQVLDPKTVDEYLELFINFNLKVYEALQLGLDTHETFVNELAGYRQQLAQPYLTDMNVLDELLEEAYQRMQYDIRASHILISVDEHATQQEEELALEKILTVRKKALQDEDFGELAKTYSDDPSAKGMAATANRPATPGNSGDLGYFSVLDMVYPFETVAYNTAIGDISEPVRTRFGYHIIKVTDRLPAMGTARVAHIMVNAPKSADEQTIENAENKAGEIYDQLKKGEDFANLAERFSDDKASGRRGGEMAPFTSNRMVPQFIKAVSELNESGEIAPLVRTNFGFHIVKLIEKKVPEREQALMDLKNRISRDSRADMGQKVVIERLKKEYKFKEFRQALEAFYSWVEPSIFQARWEIPQDEPMDEVLFEYAGNEITQKTFAEYLKSNQGLRSAEGINAFVNNAYEGFVTDKLLALEDSKLEEKYPEFRRIMAEYHDGILLFELTDQKVWSKAMQDTVGLKKFFNENIKDYWWNERLDATIFTFGSEKNAKNGRSAIRRGFRRDTPHQEIVSSLNKNSQLDVSAESGIFDRNEKSVLSLIDWERGVSKIVQYNDNFVMVSVQEILPEQAKKINEVRGLVIADYQNYLESRWVENLRLKYDYTLNREVLEQLFE